ncbi:MAG TPA: MOSC domain-containing protein [Actinomycetota bacterium]
MTGIRVAALRRFPVKSMLGELCEWLDLDARGSVGDRVWSVRTAEGKIASGKDTRRFAAVIGMLELRASERAGRVVITFPGGVESAVDDPATPGLLSMHLGRTVTVARETEVSHFDDGPVSLVGTASVDALGTERSEEVDSARFRPNILLATDEPFVEDSWIGRRVEVGSAALRVLARSPRCVMINMASADLPEQRGNLAAIGRLHDACLGVIANVEAPGRIALGDELRPA